MPSSKPRYTASIGNDPIDTRVTGYSSSARFAALAVRTYAEMGEIITVVGSRGGFTYWEAVGNGNVWKVRNPLVAAA